MLRKNHKPSTVNYKKIDLFKSELGNRDPSDLISKIKKALWICFGLFISETVINAMAFQLIGDNLLFSLLLSASVAFAVSLWAHIAGRKYKDAKNKFEKNIVIIVSAIGIIAVSAVISAFRRVFFEKIRVEINPILLTVFNIGAPLKTQS